MLSFHLSERVFVLNENDKSMIHSLLGREPRGLEDIAVRDKDAKPMVIRVGPLVDKKPFPTLFWLVDKQLNYAIDQVEAAGIIKEFQQQVDSSPELQQQMILDHQSYIDLRQSYITPEQQQLITALGFDDVLKVRGIGGIADFQRIRCLHTYYAAHLNQANAVGRLLDDYWLSCGITFDHF